MISKVKVCVLKNKKLKLAIDEDYLQIYSLHSWFRIEEEASDISVLHGRVGDSGRGDN